VTEEARAGFGGATPAREAMRCGVARVPARMSAGLHWPASGPLGSADCRLQAGGSAGGQGSKGRPHVKRGAVSQAFALRRPANKAWGRVRAAELCLDWTGGGRRSRIAVADHEAKWI
jgi:hypothetical protein